MYIIIIIDNEIIILINKVILIYYVAPSDSDENKLSAEISQQLNISDAELAMLNDMEEFCATRQVGMNF